MSFDAPFYGLRGAFRQSTGFLQKPKTPDFMLFHNFESHCYQRFFLTYSYPDGIICHAESVIGDTLPVQGNETMDTKGQNTRSRQPITAWQTHILRLTLFPFSASVDQIEKVIWWNDLMGEAPDESTSWPKVGELRQEGALNEGKLVLAVQPSRIDWRFTAAKEKPEVGEIATVGVFPESLDKLQTG